MSALPRAPGAVWDRLCRAAQRAAWHYLIAGRLPLSPHVSKLPGSESLHLRQTNETPALFCQSSSKRKRSEAVALMEKRPGCIKARGAADVFSRRQSPGRCPTYGCDFPYWALPSAVRCLGSAFWASGLGLHQPASLGSGPLLELAPSSLKASPTLPRQMFLGSGKKRSKERTLLHSLKQVGLRAWGLGQPPKLVQGTQLRSSIMPPMGSGQRLQHLPRREKSLERLRVIGPHPVLVLASRWGGLTTLLSSLDLGISRAEARPTELGISQHRLATYCSD